MTSGSMVGMSAPSPMLEAAKDAGRAVLAIWVSLTDDDVARMGLSPSQKAHYGLWSTVDVLAVDRLRFRFVPGAGTPVVPGVPVLAMRFEMVNRGESWVEVEPSDDEPIATVELPVVP